MTVKESTGPTLSELGLLELRVEKMKWDMFQRFRTGLFPLLSTILLLFISTQCPERTIRTGNKHWWCFACRPALILPCFSLQKLLFSLFAWFLSISKIVELLHRLCAICSLGLSKIIINQHVVLSSIFINMSPPCNVVKFTSSGTARILVNPFLKTTKTRWAPQRKADVAQSKAVSPAPRTITVPCIDGNEERQPHIPEWWKENPIFKEKKLFLHDSSNDTCTRSSVKLHLAVSKHGE